MLKEYLTNIADAMRSKLGTTDKINAQDFADKIDEVYNKGASSSSAFNPNWQDWRMFSYYDNRNDSVSKLKYTDTSNGTNFSSMFNYCSNLTEVPVLDTSNGTNFHSMFYNCSRLMEIPVLDTSNGTNFSNMFYRCESIKEIPQLNTSNGTNFSCMFEGCKKLTSIPALDTSKGTDFSSMFRNCNYLTEIPALDTSNGTNFMNMFATCTRIKKINKINISKATNVGAMFNATHSLTEVYFDGVININNLSITSPSAGLTHASIMSILNALADRSGESTQYTITIETKNINKLTEDEKSIATDKGWILK